MKRYRPLKGIDWVVVLLWTVIMCFILYFLTGCAKTQKIAEYDVLWSDGKCIFHAKGMTIEQAQDLRKHWNFENCDVQVKASDNAGKGVKKQ